MEIKEEPTASVDEQIVAVETLAPNYNLRSRPRLPDADDAAFLTTIRGGTVVHALELLQEPANQTASAFTFIREPGYSQDNSKKEENQEKPDVDGEVEIIAEEIIRDWRQLQQSLMHTSPASPDEQPPTGEEEEPVPGPAVPPIKMKRRAGYSTPRDVELLLKGQDGWNIVAPSPEAVKKTSKRRRSEDDNASHEGPFEVEDTLPGHLKQLRRTLSRLRATAKTARRNLDQVRRLAFDADLIQIGMQQLVGERMMETDSE